MLEQQADIKLAIEKRNKERLHKTGTRRIKEQSEESMGKGDRTWKWVT